MYCHFYSIIKVIRILNTQVDLTGRKSNLKSKFFLQLTYIFRYVFSVTGLNSIQRQAFNRLFLASSGPKENEQHFLQDLLPNSYTNRMRNYTYIWHIVCCYFTCLIIRIWCTLNFSKKYYNRYLNRFLNIIIKYLQTKFDFFNKWKSAIYSWTFFINIVIGSIVSCISYMYIIYYLLYWRHFSFSNFTFALLFRCNSL